ncbi:MAG: hypothetical protein IPL97_13440 [Niastella sp.]|nr:hypothetical protein [Niastella sp.]
MKSTIIILFSFFLIKNSFAQTVATDPELDKFVGSATVSGIGFYKATAPNKNNFTKLNP